MYRLRSSDIAVLTGVRNLRHHSTELKICDLGYLCQDMLNCFDFCNFLYIFRASNISSNVT